MKTEPKSTSGCAMVVACLAAFVLICFIKFLVNNPPGVREARATSRVVDVSKADAMETAQAAVRMQLKAPSTACFDAAQDVMRSVHIFADGTCQVDVCVDAQNGFGAMLRSQWVVRMHPFGNRWIVDRLYQQ